MRIRLTWGMSPDLPQHACIVRSRPATRRGGALLAVLWLAAALSAIAFSLAETVRGEAERAGTALDGARAYYLATGAIERTLLYMQWGGGGAAPGQLPRYWAPWMNRLALSFPTGEAMVEIIPESSKLNLNSAPPEALLLLLLALGAEPGRAEEITAAIVDWRSPGLRVGLTPFDHYYLSRSPSFRSRNASFEEVEELLLVRGMTPELFHGTYERDVQGRLVPRGGLKDCVSIFGTTRRFNVNTAHPALLAAAGLSPEMVRAIVETRAVQPFRTAEQLASFGPAAARLGIGGDSTYTLRATARPRTLDGKPSDVRRTVAATFKLVPSGDRPHTILRWQDSAWAQ